MVDTIRKVEVHEYDEKTHRVVVTIVYEYNGKIYDTKNKARSAMRRNKNLTK